MNKTPTLACPAVVFDRKTLGNKDFGDIIWYTGQGADVVTRCAVLDNKNNRALANTCAAGARNGGACAGDAWRRGSPVRVLKFIDKTHYVYCGLFKVSRYWIQPLGNPLKGDMPALIFELRRDHWLEATVAPPEATNVKNQDFDPAKREIPNQSAEDVVSFNDLAADDPLRLQMAYENVMPQRVFTDAEVNDIIAQALVASGTSVGANVSQTEQGEASAATMNMPVNSDVLTPAIPAQGETANERQSASQHGTQPSKPQKAEFPTVVPIDTVNDSMRTATADSQTEISGQHQNRWTFQRTFHQEMQHNYPRQTEASAAMLQDPVNNSMLTATYAGQSEILQQDEHPEQQVITPQDYHGPQA